MTCHNVVDPGCDFDELGPNEGEPFAEFVQWTCPDGPNSGKSCFKGISIF